MVELYLSGDRTYPIAYEEWERRARDRLEQGPFEYIAGGAGSEATMRANREAFDRWRLAPRMLTSAPERDLSTEVLGARWPVPVMLAPIGVLSIADPDAEVGAAQAAEALSVPMMLSTAASRSMEEVAEAAPSTLRWYQLYWNSDRGVVESLVRRAEAAGYRAIVVTLDTLTLGWRDRDLASTYLPFLQGEGIGQFLHDPVFRSRLDFDPEADRPRAGATSLLMHPNLVLRWDDFEWLRSATSLPILAKGVLTADDARLAFDHGLSGVVVSNHGGRQVDGSVAALDALVEVREALGRDPLVLMDSGIRRGADVAKALALGADAVLLGRPYAYGLAVGGRAGVEAVLRNLLGELDTTLALLGASAVGELDSSFLRPRPA
jgi:isopentenyl diphosphate isomerase/L-lactate dehydrogenase-like FMN-dependent dehydrogenase